MDYDLLPVNANMPADKEQLALPMNGKKQNLRKKDFLIFAESCGIARPTAEKMIHHLVSMKQSWLALCAESLLPDGLKERVAIILEERAEILK